MDRARGVAGRGGGTRLRAPAGLREPGIRTSVAQASYIVYKIAAPLRRELFQGLEACKVFRGRLRGGQANDERLQRQKHARKPIEAVRRLYPAPQEPVAGELERAL